MADWPDTDELAKVLDVSEEGDWTDTLDRIRLAAIARVKADVGEWDDDTDEPDEALAQAALRMAELMSLRAGPVVSGGVGRVLGDPTYERLIFGHRKRFGFS